MEQRVSLPSHRRRRRRRVRWRRVIGLLAILGLGVPTAGMAWGIYRAQAEAHTMTADFHAHHFVGVASTVEQLARTLGTIRTEAMFFSWMGLIPGVRGYYANAMDLLFASYQDLHVVGTVVPPVLKAVESSGPPAQKSARVSAAVSRAGLLMEQWKPAIVAANRRIQQIHSLGMPGLLARSGLTVAALKAASGTFVKLLPTMTGNHPILPNLLGIPTPQRYFIVFQNSGELRATGGFFTAYGYVPLAGGKLGKITAQNIQVLGPKVTYRPEPPMIIRYFPVSYWHIRDANTALPGAGAGVPDVPEAAHNIARFYRSISGAPSINGMVFINSWFADHLIADVDGVNVPVGGKVIHVTAQNANVTMENIAENMNLPLNQRKLFIGTLMKELLHNVLHGSVSTRIKVAETVGESLRHEQLMFYFNNPQAEHFVVQQGWGGVIPRQVHGDFVEVVDENLMGHKDNYWMHESYDVNIRTINGRNLETVTIHWMEPAISVPKPPYLVVPYHSWVTVFAPRGSHFVSMTGTASGGNGAGGGINSYIQASTDPTLNKTEFGAHMNLPARTRKSQPPARGTVVATFWLPRRVNIHRILVQKQPGLRAEPVTVTVNGVTRRIILNSRQWLDF